MRIRAYVIFKSPIVISVNEAKGLRDLSISHYDLMISSSSHLHNRKGLNQQKTSNTIDKELKIKLILVPSSKSEPMNYAHTFL